MRRRPDETPYQRGRDPFGQMRAYLTVAKRQGISFETAWFQARHRTVFEHDRRQRHDSYAALEETKWAWECAYRDEDVPAGPALLVLAEMLTDADDATHDRVLAGTTRYAQSGLGRREAA